MQYDNTNRGALFANKEKRSDKDPSARGTLNVGGVEYWVSAWTKTSKAGDKYQSLSVQPKEEKAAKPAPPPPADDLSDDIPFAWAFAVPVAGLLAAIVSSVPVA